MQTLVVRYKVRADCVAENERLVRGVFRELRELTPPGVRYASFKAADGLSFVHFAVIDTPDGSNPLPGLAAFKQFQQGLRERCEEPPAASAFTPVDDYGLIGRG